MTDAVIHPIQIHRGGGRPDGGRVSSLVTLRAYEVYRHLHGEQEAMITGGCRGGFGAGELVAFLYARGFPQNEWRQRVDEAFKGMEI